MQYAICWRTIVDDHAASVFGSALATAVAAGEPPEASFEAARAAVLAVTEMVKVGGVSVYVPKYVLDVDPASALVNGRRVRPRVPGAVHGPIAAGIPQMLYWTPLGDAGGPTDRQLTAHALGEPQRPSSPSAASSGSEGLSDLSAALTRGALTDDDEAAEAEQPVYRSLCAAAALPGLMSSQAPERMEAVAEADEPTYRTIGSFMEADESTYRWLP